MKRYRFIYTICVLLVFINISCSDFLDVEDTNPSYTNEGFYTNENAIREGATGVYSNLYMQVVGELAHTTIFDFLTEAPYRCRIRSRKEGHIRYYR